MIDLLGVGAEMVSEVAESRGWQRESQRFIAATNATWVRWRKVAGGPTFDTPDAESMPSPRRFATRAWAVGAFVGLGEQGVPACPTCDAPAQWLEPGECGEEVVTQRIIAGQAQLRVGMEESDAGEPTLTAGVAVTAGPDELQTLAIVHAADCSVRPEAIIEMLRRETN